MNLGGIIMAKYKIIMINSDGTREEEEDVFDTQEEAEDYANYLVNCSEDGAETLELSNPGDYPLDEFVEPDFEIIEIDG